MFVFILITMIAFSDAMLFFRFHGCFQFVIFILGCKLFCGFEDRTSVYGISNISIVNDNKPKKHYTMCRTELYLYSHGF